MKKSIQYKFKVVQGSLYKGSQLIKANHMVSGGMRELTL